MAQRSPGRGSPEFRGRFIARRVGSLLVTGVVVVMLAACSQPDDDGRETRRTDPASAASTEMPGGASGSATTSTADTPVEQRFPDVVGVEVTGQAGTYTFDVTISSPYDTPERYADGWRIVGTDGTVYGEHELMHDHASEQPFTRTQSGVQIPEGIDEVVVEGRDLVHGYGGGTQTVTLPER